MYIDAMQQSLAAGSDVVINGPKTVRRGGINREQYPPSAGRVRRDIDIDGAREGGWGGSAFT